MIWVGKRRSEVQVPPYTGELLTLLSTAISAAVYFAVADGIVAARCCRCDTVHFHRTMGRNSSSSSHHSRSCGFHLERRKPLQHGFCFRFTSWLVVYIFALNRLSRTRSSNSSSAGLNRLSLRHTSVSEKQVPSLQ